ncbi:MAG: GTPase, partial [Candidatus Methanomethylophilaceae archaeon]|nr:GTPase [Candidatus Methanomethylophilaceae archaeon]
MQIHVLGGFLGSGKTTLLMRIANTYIRAGKKVAVLVNEMGDIGVDGATLMSEGYNTTELPDGCVCCSLSAELQIAIRNIRRDIQPEIMLIEPTGLAIPAKIIEAIEEIPDFGDYVADIIGVVDPVRFRLFVTKKGKFMAEQLEGSSTIMMNKIDVAPDVEIEFTEAW